MPQNTQGSKIPEWFGTLPLYVSMSFCAHPCMHTAVYTNETFEQVRLSDMLIGLGALVRVVRRFHCVHHGSLNVVAPNVVAPVWMWLRRSDCGCICCTLGFGPACGCYDRPLELQATDTYCQHLSCYYLADCYVAWQIVLLDVSELWIWCIGARHLQDLIGRYRTVSIAYLLAGCLQPLAKFLRFYWWQLLQSDRYVCHLQLPSKACLHQFAFLCQTEFCCNRNCTCNFTCLSDQCTGQCADCKSKADVTGSRLQ